MKQITAGECYPSIVQALTSFSWLCCILVIGIVMLFTPRVCSRSIRDVYSSSAAGVCLDWTFLCVGCAHDYHFWHGHGGFGCARSNRPDALYFSALWMRITVAPLDRVGASYFSASNGKATAIFFSPMFTVRKSGGNLLFASCFRRNIGAGWTCVQVRSWTTLCWEYHAFVMFIAAQIRYGWVLFRRARRSYHRCYANFERMGRLTAFLHPQKFKEDSVLQQMHAWIAWGSVGWKAWPGRRQKMLTCLTRTPISYFPSSAKSGLRSAVVLLICGHQCLRQIALHAKDAWSASRLCLVRFTLQAGVNIGVPRRSPTTVCAPLSVEVKSRACSSGLAVVNIYRQGFLDRRTKTCHEHLMHREFRFN